MCSVGETSGLDVPVARGPVPRDLHRLNVPVARGPVPRDHWMTRAMARDRPSPYGEGAFFIVARGPVPRDCWMTRAIARETRSPARVACEGPSPTVKGWRFFIVVRGPVPRDRWMTRAIARETRSPARVACEGPRATVKGWRFFHRSAGACPPRSLDCADDGKGNPLACACGMRGPKPYDEEGAFYRRGPGRAALLHRDREVSPTGIYETPSEITSK